jgi:hypothetical protein
MLTNAIVVLVAYLPEGLPFLTFGREILWVLNRLGRKWEKACILDNGIGPRQENKT